MKVIITIEDTTDGVYPVVKWDDNGVTDHLSSSLSMNLAAQFASMLKRYAELKTIKVVDLPSNLH